MPILLGLPSLPNGTATKARRLLCVLLLRGPPLSDSLTLVTPTGLRLTGTERMSAAPAVVLDTNVFIAAAFKPQSDSGRVVEAVRLGTLRLVWNQATRRETEALLRKIPPISWEAVADLFQEANRRSSDINPSAFSSVTDPEDRKFAALAASTQATLLSLDHHLLGAKLDDMCAICTPSEFLDLEGTKRVVPE